MFIVLYPFSPLSLCWLNSKSAEMKSKVTFHFRFLHVFFRFLTILFILLVLLVFYALFTFVFLARKTCDLNIELILFNNLHFSISSPPCLAPPPSPLAWGICVLCYSFSPLTGSTRLVLVHWFYFPEASTYFLWVSWPSATRVTRPDSDLLVGYPSKVVNNSWKRQLFIIVFLFSGFFLRVQITVLIAFDGKFRVLELELPKEK